MVIDTNWTPLDVTRRHKHAQKLLNTGKARLINQAPYIIQLKYTVNDPAPAKFALAIDPGRTNIGISATDTSTGRVICGFHAETCNKDIPKHMQERAAHRSGRRRGERKVRLRRSHKLGQSNKQIERDGGRVYHRGRADEYTVPVYGIKPQEARYSNRKRPAGWLTPTATQLKRTYHNLIKRLSKFLPVSDICFELNKFAFMQLEDGTVYGSDYQNGRLKGFDGVEDYVSNQQEGQCAMPGCQDDIEHYHHVTPKSKGGSDRPENIVGLCAHCHEELHKGHLSLPDKGELKRFAGTSVLNQIIPLLTLELSREWGEHFHVCTGFETKQARERLGLPKEHDADAVAITAVCLGIAPFGWGDFRYRIKQYRRQDRARVRAQFERSYKKDGRVVAKNRKPRSEQPKGVPALSEAGLSRVEVSRLTVSKSRRSYNRLDRVMPGALFSVGGKLCVLTGQQCSGQYLLFGFDVVDEKGKPVRVRCKDVRLVCHNKGLVFAGRLL